MTVVFTALILLCLATVTLLLQRGTDQVRPGNSNSSVLRLNSPSPWRNSPYITVQSTPHLNNYDLVIVDLTQVAQNFSLNETKASLSPHPRADKTGMQGLIERSHYRPSTPGSHNRHAGPSGEAPPNLTF